MHLITTAYLDAFASTIPSRGRFPRLLKQLIRFVVDPKQLRIELPSDDAIWLPGVDGLVECTEENDYVPQGVSVWECGTNKTIRTKASSDFAKRRAGTLACLERIGQSQRDTTFVFSTPRVWKKKDDWIKERRDEGLWRDVVVVDGVMLQEWLQNAPPVSLEFATELGYVSPGLMTPQDAWDEWSRLTDPPLSAGVVIAGRNEQGSDLISRLRGPADVIQVRRNSSREAFGFVLAALRSLEASEQEALLGRLVVANHEETANALRNYRNLIILLKEARQAVSGYLAARGCHVLVPEGSSGPSSSRVVELARPTHREFTEALEASGIADQKIGQVLAHAPSDPADDAWPHRAIRTAVQKIGSNDLGTGLRVGRHNLRGTVSKEIFEGGGQERELAAQYRKWAQASAAWPRVARVLSVIADSYGSEAGAEDARAEHDKLDI